MEDVLGRGTGPRALLLSMLAGLFALLMSASASADWSPIAPYPGTATTQPVKVRTLSAEDGSKFIYGVAQVNGFDIVKGRWYNADGTLGPYMDVTGPGDFDRGLKADMADDGKVSLAWIGPGAPDDVVKSVDVPAHGVPGPVFVRSVGGQGIDHVSVAVTSDGTAAYGWTQLNGSSRIGLLRTVSSSGLAGPLRRLTPLPADVSAASVTVRSDQGFKYAWSEHNPTTGFYNLGTRDVGRNGAVSDGRSPAYVYPTETEKIDPVTGQVVRDAEGNPVMVPFGSTEPVRDAIVGSLDSGDGMVVWLQKSEGEQIWRARSASFTSSSVISTERLFLSRPDLDVSELSLQFQGNLLFASWMAEKNGGFATQLLRLRPSFVRDLYPISSGPTFTDPTVDVAENGAMLIGWTEEGQVPGTFEAKLLRVSQRSTAWPVEVPGLDGLKSSFAPVPVTGLHGAASAIVTGVDQNDNVGLWSTSFAESAGIGVSPSKVNFGTGLLKAENGTRVAVIRNPGKGSSAVTGVSLTGPDANDFSLLDPASCVRTLAPGESCEVKIGFQPGQVGWKNARLEVQSQAGQVDVDLTGNSIARTRLSMESQRGNQAVRPGRSFKVKASITNTGGIAAEAVGICLTAGKRAFHPKKRCFKRANLIAGATWTATFPVKVKKRASKGSRQVVVRLKAGNALAKRMYLPVKVK